LAINITKCLSCDWTTSRPAKDSEPGEPDHVSQTVCDRCAGAMERRYDRAAHAGRTLGDVVAEAYALSAASLEERADPDIREVLPRLGDEARPARSRFGRVLPRLEDALRRVGRTVCLTGPDWLGMEEFDLGPFVLAGLTEGGVFLVQANWYVVLEEEPDCVAAHDYAPDGTPLTTSE